MGVYLFAFGISTVMFYLADNMKFVHNGKPLKQVNMLLAGIAIFIPCFLAAVRDNTIGYDMRIYGDAQFEYAGRFSTYYDYIKTYVDQERLYQLVAYLSAHYANRYVYYFLLQFLTIFPFFLLLQSECKNKTWLGMLIYLLWVFPFSLNIMRQSIAIAICCYGYKYIKRNQFVRYFLLIVIGLGFHTTAILGICPYIIDLLIVDTKEGVKSSKLRKTFKGMSKLNKVLIIAGSVLLLLGGSQLITYISESTGRYKRFVMDITESSGFNISNVIAFIIMVMMIYIVSNLEHSRYKKERDYIILMLVLGMITFQLKAISSQMYRPSYYFSCYCIVGLPIILSQTLDSAKKKKLYTLAFVFVLMLNFWYFFIFRSWHSVYPYSSQFLGI